MLPSLDQRRLFLCLPPRYSARSESRFRSFVSLVRSTPGLPLWPENGAASWSSGGSPRREPFLLEDHLVYMSRSHKNVCASVYISVIQRGNAMLYFFSTEEKVVRFVDNSLSILLCRYSDGYLKKKIAKKSSAWMTPDEVSEDRP